MNKKLFAAMQEQLKPGTETLEALEERLKATPAKAKPRWGRYVALAACAALAVAAIPVYSLLNPPLHAYALDAEPAREDLEQSKGGLLVPPLDVGIGIDGTHGIGEQPMVERPVQEEAAAAYQALMTRFETDCGAGGCPDWYGGAYIDQWGGLIVCVVEAPVEDKSLFLEIQEMCGGHSVGFRDVEYTLSHLNELQEQVVALMGETGIVDQLWRCSVDEENNRVAVTLPFASKRALAGLHRLDPAGDAIAVTVTERKPVQLVAPEEPTFYTIDPSLYEKEPPDPAYAVSPAPVQELPAEKTPSAPYDLPEVPAEERDR